MKRIAVILSGCGFMDGSEIHEAVLTLLAIRRAGAQYQCFAPDIEQPKVIDHVSHQKISETRRVLSEAGRIARGEIKALATAQAADYDALILPGGFGAALTLCDFAEKGADCSVLPDVAKLVQAMATAAKPVGFICIAPVMIAKLYGPGVKMTIGNDTHTAKTLTDMGNQHIECPVDDCVIDTQHKVVSTPAYMLGPDIASVAVGIDKLVAAVLALA